MQLMPIGCIYIATNRVNGKQYVDRSQYGLKSRRDWHTKAANNGKGYLFHRAIHKYGPDAFDWKVLFECEDRLLNRWEKYYIKKLNTMSPNGYNLTKGGEGTCGWIPSVETRNKIGLANKKKRYGKKHIPETRAKISASQKGRKGKPHTDESKAKISAALKGKPKHPGFGALLRKAKLGKKTGPLKNPRSAEYRMKISVLHKGKKLFVETKAKISAAHKGKKLSAETRAKISAIQKGRPHSLEHNAKVAATLVGRPCSQETREKMRVAMKGRKITTQRSSEYREKQRANALRRWNSPEGFGRFLKKQSLQKRERLCKL